MPLDRQMGNTIAGLKQTLRAVENGRAAEVFFAADADPARLEAIRLACGEKQIPMREIPSMKALGALCGIAVGAAVACTLRE